MLLKAEICEYTNIKATTTLYRDITLFVNLLWKIIIESQWLKVSDANIHFQDHVEVGIVLAFSVDSMMLDEWYEIEFVWCHS